jgi:hypothetical protein
MRYASKRGCVELRLVRLKIVNDVKHAAVH